MLQKLVDRNCRQHGKAAILGAIPRRTVTYIVKDKFPEGLRQIFVSESNNNFGTSEPWNDTVAVRNHFWPKKAEKRKSPDTNNMRTGIVQP